MSRQQENRKGNPAQLELTQPFTQRADIDPAEREIEQQNGGCRLGQQQKHTAHRSVVLNMIGIARGLSGRLCTPELLVQVGYPWRRTQAAFG